MTMLRLATKLAVLLCCSVAFAQNGSDLIDDFSNLTADLSADLTADLSADLEVADLDINVDNVEQGFIYNARLNRDGKISGRLQMKYPTGKTTPADATVEFAQDGKAISSTTTNDVGRFETAGLEPGDYLATVTVSEDTATVPVKILPFDPTATSEMVIEGTLTPVPEGEMIVTNGCACESAVVESAPIMESTPIMESAPMQEIVVSETFAPDMAACGCAPAPVSSGFQSSCGSCGGGCGGGGGGFGGGGIGGRRIGGLLGAAGLAAGVTALALEDDDAVSPAAP